MNGVVENVLQRYADFRLFVHRSEQIVTHDGDGFDAGEFCLIDGLQEFIEGAGFAVGAEEEAAAIEGDDDATVA